MHQCVQCTHDYIPCGIWKVGAGKKLGNRLLLHCRFNRQPPDQTNCRPTGSPLRFLGIQCGWKNWSELYARSQPPVSFDSLQFPARADVTKTKRRACGQANKLTVNTIDGKGVSLLTWIMARIEGIIPSRAATYTSLEKNNNKNNNNNNRQRLHFWWSYCRCTWHRSTLTRFLVEEFLFDQENAHTKYVRNVHVNQYIQFLGEFHTDRVRLWNTKIGKLLIDVVSLYHYQGLKFDGCYVVHTKMSIIISRFHVKCSRYQKPYFWQVFSMCCSSMILLLFSLFRLFILLANTI